MSGNRLFSKGRNFSHAPSVDRNATSLQEVQEYLSGYTGQGSRNEHIRIRETLGDEGFIRIPLNDRWAAISTDGEYYVLSTKDETISSKDFIEIAIKLLQYYNVDINEDSKS